MPPNLGVLLVVPVHGVLLVAFPSAGRKPDTLAAVSYTHLDVYKRQPKGRIRKSDVTVAKNYLNETEMRNLNEIVTMYLDYAERQARRGNVMYMADWVKRLDAFLQFNEEDILHDRGKVTAAIAKAFAEKEFEKFRVLQDRTYQSDFDRLVAETSDDLTE